MKAILLKHTPSAKSLFAAHSSRFSKQSTGFRQWHPTLERMVLMARQIWVFSIAIAMWASGPSPYSDAQSPGANKASDGDRPFEDASIAKRLTSPHKRPKIVGYRVRFADDFDWTAHEAVVRNIEQIATKVDSLWPQLVEEFDNTSYSMTFMHDMSVRTYNVGDICRILVREALLCPLVEHTNSQQVINQSMPAQFDENDEFRKWCLARKREKKEFWELQVEICKRAIDLLEQGDLKSIQGQRRTQAVTELCRVVREVQSTKTAKLPGTIVKGDLRMRIQKSDLE